MQDNAPFYESCKRYQKEYAHMKDEIRHALELLEMGDAPNRISREERIEYAVGGLHRAQRFVDGEDEGTIWTC